MRFIVDRIEGDTAVVELSSGDMLKIPYALIESAKEGDAVVLTIEEKRVDTHSIFEQLREKPQDNEI